jgi:putative endonuclease
MERLYYVYILASRSRTPYTGVTNNAIRRVSQHREGTGKGFTHRYRVHRLVHYEMFRDVRAAIAREKVIKSWARSKKLALIDERNPAWEDKVEDLFPRFPRKADSSLRSE